MTEDILGKAIQKEMQSRDFYTRVSDKVTEKNAKKTFSKMAKDEDGHVSILSRRFSRLFGKDYTPVDDETSDKIKVAEAEVYTIETALQIVSLAIGLEDSSIELYINQFEKSDDSEERKILRKLVQFETGHKRKLQSQYERLKKGISWTGVPV